MLSKKISNNPTVNADRYVVTSVLLEVDRIVISGRISYCKDGVFGGILDEPFSFSTEGRYINPATGELAKKIPEYDTINGQEVKVGEKREDGSVSEFEAIKGADDTWSKVANLVNMRIQMLDLQGSFNNGQ